MNKKSPPGTGDTCTRGGLTETCPDTWTTPQEDPVNGANVYKLCGPDLHWVTEGTYGPGQCEVDCVDPDKVPCEQLRRCIAKNTVCGACSLDTDCQNGGTCNTSTGNCVCPPGFSGTNCENKFDYTCKTKEDCGPGGYDCTNGKCTCDPKAFWAPDPTKKQFCAVCQQGYGPEYGMITYDQAAMTSIYDFPNPIPMTGAPCNLKRFTEPISVFTSRIYANPNGPNEYDKMKACQDRYPGSKYAGDCGLPKPDPKGSVVISQCIYDDYYTVPTFDPVSWNKSYSCGNPIYTFSEKFFADSSFVS